MTPQTTTPRIGGNFAMHAPETSTDRMRLTRPAFVFRGGWNKWQESTHPVDVAWRQDQKAKAA